MTTGSGLCAMEDEGSTISIWPANRISQDMYIRPSTLDRPIEHLRKSSISLIPPDRYSPFSPSLTSDILSTPRFPRVLAHELFKEDEYSATGNITDPGFQSLSLPVPASSPLFCGVTFVSPRSYFFSRLGSTFFTIVTLLSPTIVKSKCSPSYSLFSLSQAWVISPESMLHPLSIIVISHKSKATATTILLIHGMLAPLCRISI